MAHQQHEVTGWVGWVFFASMMMLILGGLQAISGLVALFKDDFYAVTSNGLVAFNYTTWGWINLIMGIIVAAAGWAVSSGKLWGRIIASIMVVLNALATLAFLPAYPFWGIISLVIDGFVLFALTVHGREAAM